MVRKKTAKKKTTPKAKKRAAKKSKKLTPEEEASINEIAIRISNLKKKKQEKAESQKASAIQFTMDDVDAFLKQNNSKAKKKISQAAQKTNTSKSKVETVVKAPQKAKKVAAASLDDILGLTPSVTKNTKKIKTEADVPKKFLKYYRLLVDLRNHLSEDLAFHTSETLKKSGKEDTGDLSGYGQHMADAGSEAFDRDLALNMVSSEQEALNEVEAAIQRIFNGSYGMCEQTGEKIKDERLMVVPFTRFSLEGQQEYEKSAKKRRNNEGQMFEDSGEDIPLFTELDPDA